MTPCVSRRRSRRAAGSTTPTCGTPARQTAAPRLRAPGLPVAGRPRRAAARCRGGCARSPGSTPRDHLGDPGRIDPAEPGRATWPPRASTWRRPGADAGQRPGARLRVQPAHRYWCHRPDGALACVVAEVHNTYGERHCYLLRPDAAGRAETAKEFYVSPFLTVAGDYRMRAARPRRAAAPRRSRCASDGEHRAGRRPCVGTRRRPPRPRWPRMLLRHPLAPQRTSALIRRHGIALWLRRLPVVPRPSARTAGGRPVTVPQPTSRGAAAPTSTSCRGPTRASGPGLATPPRRRSAPASPRSLFRRAVRALPVRVVFPDGRALGAGGPASPVMRIVRPDGVLPPARRQLEDRVRRVVHGRRLDAPTELADLLTPFAARLSTLIPPGRCSGCRRRRRGAASRARRRTPSRARGRTSTATTTCPTSCSRCSSTRRCPTRRRWFAARQRRPGRRPAPQDRRHPGPGRRAGRAARAGDRHRLGRAGHPGGRSAAPGSPR